MSTQHTPEDNTLVQERVKNAPLRIMIVDDHPMVREGLAGILERQEMVIVGVAATGRQAIEMFAQYLPDILLLDLRLPDQSGIKVMRKILADRPDAKIIFLSSSQGDEHLRCNLKRRLRIPGKGNRRRHAWRRHSPSMGWRTLPVARGGREALATCRLEEA
ncbi:response regulator transcription factor [Tunturiibacter empetritectus]|uniref:response regulator n=1 Tax=Tunturiibacter empetritectus TaxID=3069691 RepID=UPI003D9BAF14